MNFLAEIPRSFYTAEGRKHQGPGWYYNKGKYDEGPFTSKDSAERDLDAGLTSEERQAIAEAIDADREIERDLAECGRLPL